MIAHEIDRLDEADRPTVDRRTIGVHFTPEKEAEVTVWAPKADNLVLCIHGIPGTIDLTKSELGYWYLKTDKLKPGNLYYFVLDGNLQRPDPASLSQPEDVHGPSRAVDTDYWEDQSWVNPPLENYLIYELHTGTFTPEGTFEAIEKKLDYLKALGVNAIEIMPVAQFPDSRNWGYDGVFPFAVNESYGGADGLHRLVNACHYRDIAVVLDVVYNHFGPEGNYFTDYGPYFTAKYCTPWGEAINFDDALCDGVRNYFVENALMWLRDFHIDALRLDAVHAIKDFSPVHILRQIKEEVNKLSEKTRRQYYLIVESDLNDPRFIEPLEKEGYGMDAQWNDEFHHALRVTAGEERKGYYTDFEGITHLAKSYKDSYVYDGQYSPHRQRLFGKKADEYPGKQFVVFSQNHDQTGNRPLGDRTSQLVSFNMLKLMAGAVLVSPYIPLLFMGEEWGELNPFLYFVSHSEPDLIEAVRKGRREEFASFHVGHDVPDPSAQETYDQSKLQWELLKREPHRTLLRYYQTLISMRQQLPALRHLDRQAMTVIQPESQETLILHRWHGEQHLLILMNFCNRPAMANIPTLNHIWHKLFDSTDAEWQGGLPRTETARLPESVTDSECVILPAESFAIYAEGHERSHHHAPHPISERLFS